MSIGPLLDSRITIADEGIELVPLTAGVMDTGGEPRVAYNKITVLDAVHLGTTLEEPIDSTDTFYPEPEEDEHIVPRNLTTDDTDE